MDEVWIGVDVSKQSLDVAARPGDESWSEQNSQAGIKALIRRLKRLSPQRIVMSAGAKLGHRTPRERGFAAE
jgi:transposase